LPLFRRVETETTEGDEKKERNNQKLGEWKSREPMARGQMGTPVTNKGRERIFAPSTQVLRREGKRRDEGRKWNRKIRKMACRVPGYFKKEKLGRLKNGVQLGERKIGDGP